MISHGPRPPGFCCQMGGGEVKGAEVVGKPEAAKEEKKEEVAVVEAGEPPLKYKRWILRVSIHCEGCKRKMKKILHSIDGVYTTEIDLRQQKVTVNGDVEADTLIKRLMKMGRHAELWPLKDNKQQGKPISKDKHDEQESGGEEPEHAGDGEGEKDDGKGDGKALEAAKKGPAAGALPVKNSVTGQIKEVNGEVKHMVPVPTGYQTAVSEGEGGAEMAGGGSGSGKKKKKKKKKKSSQGGGNNNNTDEEGPPPNEHDHAYDAPPRVSFVLDHGSTSHPANTGTPCHHPSYQFPSQSYYAGPTPVYTVSYHTSHPCSSYGTSHYYSPQPHSNAYEYVHPFSPEIEHMPSAIEMCSSPAAETFDVLSDENPHACLVM